MQRNQTTFASIETLETRTLLSGSLNQAAFMAHEQSVGMHVSAKHVTPAKQSKPAHVKPSIHVKPTPAPKPAKKTTPAPTPKPTPAPAPAVVPAAPALPAVAVEPGLSDKTLHYKAFTGSLFSSTGPSENDINQGEIGDCYFLSTLSAIAKTDASLIRNHISDLGDGTYLVRFNQNGAEVDVRVDNQLPVFANGTPGYAKLGQQNSLWVAVMEKAFAAFRTGANSYSSIESGWMDEAFAAFGIKATDLAAPATGDALLASVAGLLAAGKAVTFADNAPADGASLIAAHAYTVDSVVTDASGKATGLRLRNPWGVDGIGNDGSNDGYVTLTAAQAKDSMLGVAFATV